MRRKRRSAPPNIYEMFSDIALLMLATFIFLLVTILITARMAEQYQAPRLKSALANLQIELDKSNAERKRLLANMNTLASLSTEKQMEKALAAAGLAKGKNHKDFDVFVKGLRDLPGNSLHLLIDATGSMHGVSDFLIPVLRVIVIRSGKKLDALTWFSDGKADTYRGTMGEMFDRLMEGAPFTGANETIGYGFRYAADHAPAPGAYLLIGDEPPADRIHYFHIPSPVYTLPIGHDNPETNWHYQKLAAETGGKMLHLELK
ncbi:MAG TPA: hypothetical protein ENK04_03415 [Gammaproteobacteria bacterium]|nr:hypothetical protein [Gammaproteobacteria bacterium]